MTNSVNTWKMT